MCHEPKQNPFTNCYSTNTARGTLERHASQGKGSSLLSKTNKIKQKGKNCSLHVKPFTDPSQTSPVSARPLCVIWQGTADFFFFQ
jgi:hypothetical protein